MSSKEIIIKKLFYKTAKHSKSQTFSLYVYTTSSSSYLGGKDSKLHYYCVTCKTFENKIFSQKNVYTTNSMRRTNKVIIEFFKGKGFVIIATKVPNAELEKVPRLCKVQFGVLPEPVRPSFDYLFYVYQFTTINICSKTMKFCRCWFTILSNNQLTLRICQRILIFWVSGKFRQTWSLYSESKLSGMSFIGQNIGVWHFLYSR